MSTPANGSETTKSVDIFQTGSSQLPESTNSMLRLTSEREPRRLNTAPGLGFPYELRPHVSKRLIVCCDGTLHDGIGKDRSVYTNVLRLARTINHADERYEPPIPQIVFYQAGVGTDNNIYSEYVDGATGLTLASKVEEAYAFIAHNYTSGDEIFLFGFSRGAYTARLVAMFIGDIGILDRREMDNFATIFFAFHQLGKSEDPKEIAALREKLKPWCHPDAPGRLRADVDGDTFNIKCIGAFDTVNAIGLPDALSFIYGKAKGIFGFPEHQLGEQVERAYQALGLDETRIDFNCSMFVQSEAAKKRGQMLKQCWFPGSHTDVGGGYKEHDLSDLALFWMAGQIEDILSLDIEYLAKLPSPVAPWGQQKPHISRRGIFRLSSQIQRVLPTKTCAPNWETIHPSVLEQTERYPALDIILKMHPEIICELSPLEQGLKINWPYKPETNSVAQEGINNVQGQKSQLSTTRSGIIPGTVRSTSSRSAWSLISAFSLKRRTSRPAASGIEGDPPQNVKIRSAEDTERSETVGHHPADCMCGLCGHTRRLKKPRRKTVVSVTATSN